MIPQLGFGEMLVIAVIALVVVGPKDLPVLMRKVGGFVNQIKGMGREFREAFDEMGAEEEIKALQKELADLRDGKVEPSITDEMVALDTELRRGIDPGV